MFQLDFFKYVKAACNEEPWKNTYLNAHLSAINGKKCGYDATTPEERMLMEYIQLTYPDYFGITFRYPANALKNSNKLTPENRAAIFFDS